MKRPSVELSLLVLGIFMILGDAKVCSPKGGPHPRAPLGSVVLASTPAAGHITSLLSLARSMKARDPNLTFVVPMAKFVFETSRELVSDFNYQPQLERAGFDLLDMGEKAWPDDLLLKRATQLEELIFVARSLRFHNVLYHDFILEEFADNKPKFIIYEEMSAFVGHAAHELKVPALAISPHATPAVSFAGLPYKVPHMAYLDTSSSFFTRFFYSFFRPMMDVYRFILFYFTVYPECNARGITGFDCIDTAAVSERYGQPVIMSTSPPLQISTSYPPHTFFVGPLIEEDTIALGKDWQAWLDETKANYRGFAMIGTGSMVNLSHANVDIVLDVFDKIAKKENLRILWARSKEYLADINVSPPSAHWTFASFVPQKALLQSPLIKFFLSHCGSGGLAESLYFGVPIICMPQMVDQFANADMAHIMGMPKPLPLTLQKAPLDALFTEFFANYDNYKELAMHAKRSFALGGGIKRATDIAFQTMEMGFEGGRGWVAYDAHWSWWQKLNLDVFIVWLLLLYLVLTSLKKRFFSTQKLGQEKQKQK